MTVQAKQLLLNDIQEGLDEYMPRLQSNRVMVTVNDKLSNYDVEEIKGGYEAKNDELLKAFLQAKAIEGRSPKTIDRYSYMLEKSLNDIGVPVKRITVFHIRSYLMKEKERGLMDTSLEGVRSIFSTFFGWLWKEGLIDHNPVANIGSIKSLQQVRIPFSALEMELIKQSCRTARERAIVSFLRATGCRIGEVCKLNRDSIDFESREVKVLGKGNKERIVYFDQITAMELKRYFSGRKDSDQCLFCGIRGRYSEQGFRAMLKQLEGRSGVPNIHPHRFRRTLATDLILKGMPIQEVAYILGHSNINTTLKYVTISKVQVKNAYNKYIN